MITRQFVNIFTREIGKLQHRINSDCYKDEVRGDISPQHNHIRTQIKPGSKVLTVYWFIGYSKWRIRVNDLDKEFSGETLTKAHNEAKKYLKSIKGTF